MAFGLPADSLGLSLLAEVAANPEQVQEHKPLPPLFAHRARGASLWIEKPNCSHKQPSRLEGS